MKIAILSRNKNLYSTRRVKVKSLALLYSSQKLCAYKFDTNLRLKIGAN